MQQSVKLPKGLTQMTWVLLALWFDMTHTHTHTHTQTDTQHRVANKITITYQNTY